ncbi:NAD(P)/FAD-dependent oxidoreductase [Kitasatospora sp. CB01950]|uniref:NAD(P)/FAD-dependent oxidoreductase n=1 Tax=Kitasatospora sp. CB01950 TaxID=1703930 RepID=UPI000939E088|nr:FAD-dependent oxidoreductase [Kitasatospora sp. CB01950]OKJ11679.1 oxidoreductase [Kitasatospora sp. CB01950]
MESVIVVGGGLAGLRAVEALRSQGYTGNLTLVGAEVHEPYDRPPLSKSVLTGESTDTALPADWEHLRCALRLGERAEALRLHGDRPGGILETTAGALEFDGLVVATGGTPIRLPGEGPQHVVRTVDDVRGLRDSLREGARLVIVGAGWIGAEVATVAAGKGCRVTVLEAADTPLAGAIGPELGELTARWYAEAGVELRCGVKVASVDRGGLLLVGGEFVAADAVVTGIGVRPETDWLADSGLDVGRGVVVDASLRTSRPEVVAAGDCAAWWSDRYGRRLLVEHWDTALNAPAVAASSLLGQDAVYDPVPYFWSEQFGRMVQYAGHHPAAERMVFRGSPDGPDWAVLWLSGDRLVALLTVDRPRDMVQGRRLIENATALDTDLAVDPGVALRNAVRRGTGPGTGSA